MRFYFGEFDIGSTNNPISDIFFFFNTCQLYVVLIYTVRRNSVLVTHGSLRVSKEGAQNLSKVVTVFFFCFPYAAPISLRFEPVGRWYEANIHRRQHGLSSHHSSSSASSSAGSEADFSSDEEDHNFLLTLDPTDCKVKVQKSLPLK